MKNSNLAGLIGLLIAGVGSIVAQPLGTAAKTAVGGPAEMSPRLADLKKRLSGGDSTALPKFWASLEIDHAPLLEPIADQPGKSLVTFIWRAEPGTTDVSVVGRQMSRLLDTDLWFATDIMDSSTPMFYAFFPTVAGQSKGRCVDPMNPHRFALSDDVLAAVPADLKGENSQWLM